MLTLHNRTLSFCMYYATRTYKCNINELTVFRLKCITYEDQKHFMCLHLHNILT